MNIIVSVVLEHTPIHTHMYKYKTSDRHTHRHTDRQIVRWEKATDDVSEELGHQSLPWFVPFSAHTGCSRCQCEASLAETSSTSGALHVAAAS